MAFNINPGKQQFSATASQTVFTFNFAIFADTDLKVYKTLAGAVADDTADLLTLSTHYTVSINGTLGGTVTLLSGASLNDTITIVRVLPVTRSTDYVTNGDLYADTLDLDQDYQTYLVQDGYVQLERAIIIPESLSGVSINIPAPIADAYLRWNATADALENDVTIPQKLIDSQTAATTATTQAGIATTQAGLASTSATNAQLRAWEAEAERLTADSYATEAENIFVKSYTSNGNGTFTATNTAEYSALHWSAKSALSALGSAVNISYDNAASGMAATNVQTALNEIDTRSDTHIPLSGVTAYHLLSGSLSLSNSVITAGMGTFTYTGNTTTLPTINLGMDIQSQWGNLATETFGYLIEIKPRSAVGSWYWVDSVRGITKAISSDSTAAEVTDANMFTLSTVAGVTTVNIGTSTKTNTNAVTYVMTVWQTTHRTTGTTNHGKTFNCHYNPFMGLVIDGYEGSGLAGHEIPHHLGRKLGFTAVRNLGAVNNWHNEYVGLDGYLKLNLTDAIVGSSGIAYPSDNIVSLNTYATINTSANQYILYGWANSYFDEANTLIGNYEVGVYQGTGAAGNKVTTRGKPAWVMIKRLDGVESWVIQDNLRVDKLLWANLSDAEGSSDVIDLLQDGFIFKASSANTSGGQYLYMVVYDNDSGSGKSKYNKATDTSALSLTATVPFANGIDANGTKNTVLTKNETITGLALTQGKNYVYAKNDGLYGVKAQAPQYGSYNGFGDYFDVAKNQWYQSPSAYSNDGTITTGFTAVNGTLVSTNGTLVLTNGTTVIGYAHNLLTLTAGKKYRVKLLRSSGNDSWAVKVGTTANGVDTYSSGTQTASGEFTFDFVAVATNYLTVSNITATTGLINTFDNIAIYPINDDGSVDITSATPITESRNYLDAIVYADVGGQPTFVEQLSKIEYKKDLEVQNLVVSGGFDLGEKIYSLTASRWAGFTYTNTSGREKTVILRLEAPATANVFINVFVDNTIVAVFGNAASALSNYGSITVKVPPNSTYSAVKSGALSILTWSEIY